MTNNKYDSMVFPKAVEQADSWPNSKINGIYSHLQKEIKTFGVIKSPKRTFLLRVVTYVKNERKI